MLPHLPTITNGLKLNKCATAKHLKQRLPLNLTMLANLHVLLLLLIVDCQGFHLDLLWLNEPILNTLENKLYCQISINFPDLDYASLPIEGDQFISFNKTDCSPELIIKDLQSLRFEKCSFKYQNSTNKIFDEIDFQLRSNECIGIQGESGSGKTTFIDMILGFLNPYEGLFINKS